MGEQYSTEDLAHLDHMADRFEEAYTALAKYVTDIGKVVFASETLGHKREQINAVLEVVEYFTDNINHKRRMLQTLERMVK